ncbi:MAG: hypothetical protein RSB69_11820 [Odoribacter sp.]
MKTNATVTSRKAYSETEHLRETEKIRMRQYFTFRGSDFSCCRTELLDPMQFPINHCTRCVYDLIEDGFLEVKGKKISQTSGKLVESIGLKERGLQSKSYVDGTGFRHIGDIINECMIDVNERQKKAAK